MDQLEKHGMILFLSQIQLDKATTEPSSVTKYKIKSGEVIQGVDQTSEAAIIALAKQLAADGGKRLSHVFCIASNRVRTPITIKGVDRKSTAAYVEEYVKTICPELLGETQFHVIAYDEDKSLDAGLDDVAKMAEEISASIGDGAILHADMTGGMRHASMMMLVVMRLMEYRGMRAGDVLYSSYNRENQEKNEVSSAQNVYRAFSLVSGVDEFINYGSVRTLNRYFKPASGGPDERSDELKNLLDAMKEFSDTISICRTGYIEENLKKLRKTLYDFQKKSETEQFEHNATPQQQREHLFSILLGRLKNEYEGLLEPDPDRVKIIRWCKDKELLQQAMTLCSEWIPRCIAERGVFFATDAKMIERSCRKIDKQTDWHKTFVVNDAYTMEQVEKDLCSKLRDHLREMLENPEIAFRAEEFSYDTRKVGRLPVEVRRLEECLHEHANGKVLTKVEARALQEQLAREVPEAYHLLKYLYNNLSPRRKAEQSVMAFIESVGNHTCIANRLSSFGVSEIEKVFGITFGCKETVTYKVSESTREDIMRDFLASGVASTDYPDRKEDIFSAIRAYTVVRQQRNKINHGDVSTELSADDVKSLIKECLAQLETFPAKGA